MPKKVSVSIPKLEAISEITILWVEFGGPNDGPGAYRASKKSIEWIPKTKVLRVDAASIEGDDYDLAMDIKFGSSGVVAKVDGGDGDAHTYEMNQFTGRSGLVLDYRTRSKYLSIFIAAVPEKDAKRPS